VPDYIPAISAPLQEHPPDDLRWFALHGGKVSRAVWEGKISPREQFRLPPDSKIAFHLFIYDDFLEVFWKERRERYAILKGFDLVFAPNFSIYEDAPRFEHLFNMRRSAIVVKEMAEEGIRVVPDVSWYCREDIDRWLEFLDSTGAEVVSFSFQVVGRGLKGSKAWVSYLPGLRYFAQQFSGRIVLVGVVSPERYRLAVRAAGRPLAVLDTKSFVTARRGGMMVRGKVVRGGGRDSGKPRDVCFFEMAACIQKILAEIDREECEHCAEV
jgi:hypothetical protein